MRVALVHDDFMQWGGAERVVEAMMELWPEAPVYTIAYDPNIVPSNFPVERLRTSIMQKKYLKKLFYPKLFFLDPLFFELFSINDFDVVISSSTRFAKSIVTRPDTLHIAYINSPPRFLWPVSRGFGPDKYIDGFVKSIPIGFRTLVKWWLRPIMTMLRMHDVAAAQRIDYLIGNSGNVARRIEKFYQREADVVYPFADLERFRNVESRNEKGENIGEYYLIVSRLSSHKRVDLAIEAFNRLGWPLKIIGSGPERERLERMAGDTIEFLGFVSDEDVIGYMQQCRAFLYPQEEDFGITAVEAQAAGKPVIAYAAGGALETVVEGETGLFFHEQTVETLIQALQTFETLPFDPEKVRQNAQNFSKERFKEKMRKYVEEKKLNTKL